MNLTSEPARAAFPSDIRTVVYGVGAQKAATTWLFRQLVNLPDVHMPMPKELHYWDCIRPPYHTFSRDQSQGRRDAKKFGRIVARVRALWDPRVQARIERDIHHAAMFDNDPFDHTRYVAHMVRRRGTKSIVGEITPAYALVGCETFREMASLHNDTRFVFILRDPVNRLWSGVCFRYREELKRGVIAAGSLVRAFISAAEDLQNPDRARSDYVATLRRMDMVLKQEQILVLFYETLMEPDSVETLRRFLGLSALPISREVVHGSDVKVDLPPEAAERARKALSPIYNDLEARFGQRLPRKWRLTEGAA